MRRFAVVLSVTALAAASLTLGSFTVASGADSSTFSDPGSNGTEDNQFVVPDGVCQVTVDAIGARGGDGSSENGDGGLGGEATATIPVTPGETLSVFVGGRGGDVSGGGGTPGAGGKNGGGDGGDSTGSQAAGGGGGASDVRQGGTALSDRVVVAGGGGGGGGASSNDTHGGDGGGTTGDDGGAAAEQANPGLGGAQTLTSNGGAGQNSDGSFNAAFSGQDGVLGIGGDGADGTGGGGDGAGGGGGGGFFGGGGAGAKDFFSGAGGGGGSGFTPEGTGMSNGVDPDNDGNGTVEITPEDPGIGCPSTLEVGKVVTGTSATGFTVQVNCTRPVVGDGNETTVDHVNLPFAKDGTPDTSQTPTGWVVDSGVWQLTKASLEGSTCAVTETGTGGATSVSYACTWTPGVSDHLTGVGCPGAALGPSAVPSTVTFEGNGDAGKVILTNTFVATTSPTSPTTSVIPVKFTG